LRGTISAPLAVLRSLLFSNLVAMLDALAEWLDPEKGLKQLVLDVTLPNGTTESYGRIQRSNVTWDSEFQVFTLQNNVEESATRIEDISMDYDFFHSALLAIPCNADYTATFIPRDINVWCSRLFLGDADGFGIVYYQDVDSLVYWANEAAYRWGLRGFALWSLGQEDLRLWESLPKLT